MKLLERKKYIVQKKDASGISSCQLCKITDTGSDIKDEKYIKDHLKKEYKTNKDTIIIKLKNGSPIERTKEELKSDVIKAIEKTNFITVGFASKFISKRDRKAIGAGMIENFDDPNFHLLFILAYGHDSKSYRTIETEKFGINPSFFHGGHVTSKILNKYYNLYIEHKGCLDDDDINEIIKKRTIYNIEKRQVIKTSMEIPSSIAELISIGISISKKRQKRIGDWIEPKKKNKK